MSDFFRTPMGRRYYEVDLPNLIHQLERIASCLERPIAIQQGGINYELVRVNGETYWKKIEGKPHE